MSGWRTQSLEFVSPYVSVLIYYFVNYSALTLVHDWLSPVYPSHIAFALSLAQSVFPVQCSTQGDQLVVLAGSSTSGISTWWLLPQLFLGNLPGRAQAVKACHLSPPDGNVTARGLLHPVGGEQTEFSLLQIISVWKFPLLQVISDPFPSLGRWMCLEGCFYLLLSTLYLLFSFIQSFEFFSYTTYSCLQLECSFPY